MSQNKRPVQAYDVNGRPLNNFVEGRISTQPVPADGAWHKLPGPNTSLRIQPYGGRAGVLYTTTFSSDAPPADGQATDAPTLAAAAPLAAGGSYTLNFATPGDVWVTADPNAAQGLQAPLLCVVQAGGV